METFSYLSLFSVAKATLLDIASKDGKNILAEWMAGFLVVNIYSSLICLTGHERLFEWDRS